MTDFYSQNRCVCSTRSHGPLLCAFCLSFHFNDDVSMFTCYCNCLFLHVLLSITIHLILFVLSS